ncbi:MAG: DEAD/DEAH box helicase [Acidobacteria bacterium]|nr:DEAD/DEAH box helicase [Acidobacteriota bacterium]
MLILMNLSPLPIDELLPKIRSSLDDHRHAVIVSPPGSGKTTRVPPALIDDGDVILLQPRRVAARSLARRIASEREWTPGETVGWQIRLDSNFSRSTRLLVCTEGILTARLQSDPLLTQFRTVILDEFHERSVHSDLALAMLREAAEARDDLRIVIMSATIDPRPAVEFLSGTASCATIWGEGGLYPVTLEYRPGASVRTAVAEAMERTSGDVLVFLPGRREIDRARTELSSLRLEADIEVLHGGLTPVEQDRAIASGSRRKVILSTNIAETSLTVEGVSPSWTEVFTRSFDTTTRPGSIVS